MSKKQHSEETVEKEDAPDPIFASIQTTCKILDVGKTTVFELINAEELDPYKYGAKTLLSMASVKRCARRIISGEINNTEKIKGLRDQKARKIKAAQDRAAAATTENKSAA